MYRSLETRRRRTILMTIGLVTAASIGGGTVRTAHAQQPDGKKIFATTCAACHQQSGEGQEGKYPPLAGSEFVAGDEAKLVRIILHGLGGPVEVAGETYDGAMPGWSGVLKDPEIAAVASYIRSAWGNSAAAVTAAKVTSIRAATTARKGPWTAAELAQVMSVKK
jgi:mono/diheme cytochrome c family protein